MIFIKRDLLYLIAFFLIVIYFNSKTEMMSNTDITKRIKEIYNIDVDAIRNLSKLANDLTNNGKLVVPGGLEIKGKLTVKGGGDFSGGRYYFTDAEKCGRLRVGCAWGKPGIYAEDKKHLVLGASGGNVQFHNNNSRITGSNAYFSNVMKQHSDYYIYQVNGHYGGKFLHGHNNNRVGTAAKQYRTKFRFS